MGIADARSSQLARVAGADERQTEPAGNNVGAGVANGAGCLICRCGVEPGLDRGTGWGERMQALRTARTLRLLHRAACRVPVSRVARSGDRDSVNGWLGKTIAMHGGVEARLALAKELRVRPC